MLGPPALLRFARRLDITLADPTETFPKPGVYVA